MNGQEAAILKEKGACIILAGAGTGKTYTIVEKIKYLIKNKIYSPEKVVCITFSNEAANNLIGRVQKALIFENGKEPIIKTFHAFSAELLRKYGDKIGINKEFNVLTPDEAKIILFRYLKVPAWNCHRYISSIGTAKDLGISMESLKEYLDRKLSEFGNMELEKRLESLQFELNTLYLGKEKWKKKGIAEEIKKITSLLELRKFINAWGAYEKIKAIRHYQDYSDLNKNALRLLKEYKETSKNYDYIIVDEFQDTNKIQLELLFCLAPQGNVTIVGDLNQSIYRFRGAYNRNFEEFKKKFNVSENEIFSLDRSFRSSNKILRTAHKLISNNYAHRNEACFEVLSHYGREGGKIEVCELKNGKEEARKVAGLVEEEIKKGTELREICIMFRTHQQGKIIKRMLESKKIPFISVDKSSLLKEKSIKSAADYLTILDKLKERSKGGEEAWWDLIYHLEFIEEDLIKVGKFIKLNKNAENISAVMLSSLGELELSDAGRMAVKILIERIKRLIPEMEKGVPELIKEIYNIGGLINGQKTKEEKAIMLNLNRFYELAKEHSIMHAPDLGSFIHYFNILESLGIEIQVADSEEDGVRLMTLHATKGLEYKTVIITNMGEKRFPLEHMSSNPLIPMDLSSEFGDMAEGDIDVYEHERQNQLFEERRLCYVAFTRAKERLILTYANEYGGKRYYPSLFLSEVCYKENPDFSFGIDFEEKYEEPEIIGRGLQFSSVLKSWDFDNTIAELARNCAKPKNLISSDELCFSPSALLTFVDCQKKYEYKYIYNMPEQKSISWDALMLGSFVHRVLDVGVKRFFFSLKEFEDLAREMHLEPDWEDVELDDALHLVRVFFERNKGKYGKESKTEQVLKIRINGLNFMGFADRIDFLTGGIEIIDYKTGRGNISPRARDWQLGYYALAASSLGKVKRITLDMLRHEKPLEFELDEKGDARAINSSRMEGFNIYAVEQELVSTAHEILLAYEKGFKPCPVEKHCKFCSEWVYGV